MRILAEYAAFVAMSVGAHVLVLSQPGGQATGADAPVAHAAQVSLAAMPADLSDMVAQWTRPPETQDRIAPPDAPEVTSYAPPGAAPETPVMRAQPVALPAAQAPLSAPQIHSAAPPKPALPKAEAAPNAPPQTRPNPRPQNLPAIVQPTPEAAPKAQVSPPRKAQPKANSRPKPKTKTAKPSAPRTTAKGAGSAGGKAASKPAVKPAVKAPSKARTNALMAQWQVKISRAVRPDKRKTRAKGRVVLRIDLDTSGRLRGVRIARSSGHAALDKAALSAVKRARFPKAPRGIPAGTKTFNLPISFAN